MKRFLLSILFFVGAVSFSYSQDFFAVQNGLWNDGATWGNASPGTEGVDWPGSGDVVALESFSISLPRNGNFTCDVLYFTNNVANQLVIAAGRGALPTMRITEAIIADDGPPNFIPTAPTVQLFATGIDFTFTGEKLSGFSGLNGILGPWSTSCAFGDVIIDQGAGSTVKLEDILPISTSITVANGSFDILASGTLTGVSGSETFNVNTGTNLSVNGAINGNANNTLKFNEVNIQGNVTTGTSGYINSDNFTLGSSSTLTINFNGPNQTQGWWYQGTGPTGTFSLDAASTVIYNASANQVVGAQEYGDLRLRSQSGASVKSLQSSGNLLVQGLLRLNSGNVTFDTSPNTNPINIEGNVQNLGNWSPTQLVIFSGPTPQSINGANQITFAGGLRVSNTAGLTLNNIGIDINGELDVDPSCSFNPSDQVVTVLGDMRIDGTLIAGTNPGGFVFDGTTEFLGSGTRGFYDWTIDATASVLAPLGGNLTIHRNWTNNGSFAHNNGLVTFSDAPTKSISGSANTSFYNLAAEGGTVNVNGNVDLENVMSFANSPTVDLDGSGSGSFTLLSSQTRDAAIDNIGSATLQGNINVQRAIYTIGGDGRGYHIVGFPVTGLTVAEIQDELSVTGPFSGASACPTSDCTYSIYAYDEAAAGAGVFDDGYVGFPASGNGESFINGEGYYIFNYAGEPASGIIEGNGSVFSGNFSTTLSRGASADAGWHMVANPYPAATDWSQWDRSGIDAGTAYLYNPSSQAYEPLDGAVQQVIPQGQGIFVRATSNGAVLSSTEASKVTGTTPTYYRTLPQERIEIILRTPDYDDKTIVSFNQNATDNYEPQYDAVRLLNTYETLSTLTEDDEMVKVNRLAPVTNNTNCSRTIKLNLEQMVVGDDYALDFKGISTVSTQELILKDNYLGTENLITDDLIYNFQVTSEAVSAGSGRFEVVLNTNQPNQISTLTEDVCPQQNPSILLENTQSFVNYLIVSGNDVIASLEGNGSDISTEIDNSLLSSNLNEFTIKAFVSGCDTTTVGNAQLQLFEELSLNNSVSGSSICSSASDAAFTVDTQVGVTYYILNGQDTIQTIQGTGNEYSGFISDKNLSSGLNQFNIGAEKDGCQSGTLDQQIEINYQDVQIDQSIVFETNDVCYDNSASVSFTGQSGVEYQVYSGPTLVNTLVGDGSAQAIIIDKTDLNAGFNEFTMRASFSNCIEYEFIEKIIVNVEEQIMQDLEVTNANSCGTSNALISINNAQSGKTYNLISAEQTIVSAIADQNGVLAIEVDPSNLTAGLNQFDILIEGQNCAALTANQKAEVNYVESAVIEGINDYSICLNESVIIDLVANVEMASYQLFLGEELVVEETGNSILVSPEETTSYILTGVSAEGCEVNSVNFTIEVTDLSKPGILISDNVLESSVEGDSYQWYRDGELLPEETGKLLVVNQTGDYSVEVTKTNCSAISDLFNFNEDVLNADKALENALHFYPNPVGDKMFVELNNINSVNITIFTINGKFIDSFELKKNKSEIDMSKYSKGSYLIQFKAEDKSITKRLMKQ